ncbi:MAG: hypothetical protein Hals2KO_25490 [Halioglobus sp.]
MAKKHYTQGIVRIAGKCTPPDAMKPQSLASIVLLLSLTASKAALAGPMQFSFDYLFDSGASLKGTLVGELQADLNTILVQDFELNYNNLLMPIPAGPLPGPQLASLNGEVMSLSGLGEHFVYPISLAFELSSQTGRAWVDLVEVSTNFELERDTYDPRRLQIQRVPVPATMALVMLGLIQLRVRRQSTH